MLSAEAANGREYFAVPMYKHAHLGQEELCAIPDVIWANKQGRTKHYVDCHRSHRYEISTTRAGTVWACLRLNQDRQEPIRFHESSSRPYDSEIKKVVEQTSTAFIPEHTESPGVFPETTGNPETLVRSEERTARAAQTLCILQDPPHPPTGPVAEPQNLRAVDDRRVTSPETSVKVKSLHCEKRRPCSIVWY